MELFLHNLVLLHRVSGNGEQAVGTARVSGSGVGGTATAVLEVGEEEPNSVMKTMRGRRRPTPWERRGGSLRRRCAGTAR